MKTTIYKYVLPLRDSGLIEIKGLIGVLSVTTQGEEIVMYVMVDKDDEHTGPVRYAIRGTGHDATGLNKEWKFMGTMHLLNDPFMFHVFVQRAWCWMA
jgi:hypothetical protein